MFVRFPTDSGMVPVMLLNESSRIPRLGIVRSGSGPTMPQYWASKSLHQDGNRNVKSA